MMHAGELVSKADLTEHIYQQDFDRDSNVLEVFIARLRKKLDPDGTPKPIETVRGRGYRFAIPRNRECQAEAAPRRHYAACSCRPRTDGTLAPAHRAHAAPLGRHPRPCRVPPATPFYVHPPLLTRAPTHPA